MKRSKIFLGVTTCLLAVAGVAAAKRFGPSVQRWYCTIGNGSVRYCAPVSETCITKLTGTNLKLCTISYVVGDQTKHAPVYLTGAFTLVNNVAVPLPCDDQTNCITQIKYTRNN